MHAGIRTEMAVFEGLSKQSDVTTLNWGKGGHASFFARSLTGWMFFLKNPVWTEYIYIYINHYTILNLSVLSGIPCQKTILNENV